MGITQSWSQYSNEQLYCVGVCMRLSEIFNHLACGELANLHLSDNAKSIFDDKKEIVLRSINLGLLDLYTRFYLKRKSKELSVDKSTLVYVLDEDECIEITDVSLGLGKLYLHLDYELLNTKTIKLKEYPQDKAILTISYKARHKTLTQQDINDDTDVELPVSYMNALFSFIASRLYTSIVNQLDGDLSESNRYAQRYVQEIQLLNEQGIDVDNLHEHDWFNQRGFI